MIWPQQYHKEKQGMQAQIEALEARCERLIRSIDFAWRTVYEGQAVYEKAVGLRDYPAASPSQPVEAPGKQPQWTCSNCNYMNVGSVCTHCRQQLAPQPEAPAAEQQRFYAKQASDASERWFLMDREQRTDGLFTTGMSEATAKHNARVLNGLLDVNPESPTDATRGVGDDPKQTNERRGLWIGRGFFSVEKRYMSGVELRNLPTPAVTDDYDLWQIGSGASTEDERIAPAAVVEISDGMRFFLAPAVINAGSGDDPIPQREWTRLAKKVLDDVLLQVLPRVSELGPLKQMAIRDEVELKFRVQLAEVLLPQPIDPRSEA